MCFFYTARRGTPVVNGRIYDQHPEKVANEKMRLLYSYMLLTSLYFVKCITRVQEPTEQECGLSLKERRNIATFSNTGNINTTISKYPWTAAILKYKGRSPSIFCGGSLISRKHIVTAGHCVIDQEKDSLKVVLGATDAFLEGLMSKTFKYTQTSHLQRPILTSQLLN